VHSPDLHVVERAEKHRDALVLGHVGIRSGDEEGVLTVLRPGREHLLTVDHPLLAVTNGAGAG